MASRIPIALLGLVLLCACAPLASALSIRTCDEDMTELTANDAGAFQNMPCSLCDAVDGTRDNCELLIDVPSGCAGSNDCAVIIFFHGTASGTQPVPTAARDLAQDQTDNVHSTDRDSSFIGVYPLGDPKSDNPDSLGWNTGSSLDTPDDTGFIVAIMETLRGMGWSGRSYAYGHSNGAAMTQQVAVNGALGFSGAVTASTQLLYSPHTSGPAPLNFNHPIDARPYTSCTVPISMLSLHGAEDTTISYNGQILYSSQSGSEYELYSVDESNQIWAETNGCTAGPTTSTYEACRDATGCVDSDATLSSWEGCADNVVMEAWKVGSGEHDVASTIDGRTLSDLAFDFYDRVETLCKADGVQCPPEPTEECQDIREAAQSLDQLNDYRALHANDYPDVCSDDCSNSFAQCMRYRTEKRGQPTAASYQYCRSDMYYIDTPLGSVCAPEYQCTDTIDMALSKLPADIGAECSTECERSFVICVAEVKVDFRKYTADLGEDGIAEIAYHRCRLLLDMGDLNDCDARCQDTEVMGGMMPSGRTRRLRGAPAGYQ